MVNLSHRAAHVQDGIWALLQQLERCLLEPFIPVSFNGHLVCVKIFHEQSDVNHIPSDLLFVSQGHLFFISKHIEWIVRIMQFFTQIILEFGLLALLPGFQCALLPSHLGTLSFIVHQTVDVDILEVASIVFEILFE